MTHIRTLVYSLYYISLLGLLLVSMTSLHPQLADALSGQAQQNSEGVRVSAPGEGITVKAKEPHLYPEHGKDFFLSVKLRFHHFPSQSDRIFVLKNFGSDGSGYALAIDSDGKEYRPVIYWSNGKKRGRWYSFATIDLPEKEWTEFIIHYSRKDILGLHIAQGSHLKSLGGYNFENSMIPSPDRSLVIGAVGTASFRGRIGDVHVYLLEKEIPIASMVQWLAEQGDVSLLLDAESHLLSFDGISRDTSVFRRTIDVHVETRDEAGDRSVRGKRKRNKRANTDNVKD